MDEPKNKRGGGVWAEVTKAGWVRVMGGRLLEAGRQAVGSRKGVGGGLAVGEEKGVRGRGSGGVRGRRVCVWAWGWGGGVWAELTQVGWVRVMGGRLREAGCWAVGDGSGRSATGGGWVEGWQ